MIKKKDMLFSMYIHQIFDVLPVKVEKYEPIVNGYYRLISNGETFLLKKISTQEEKLISYYALKSKRINIPIQIIPFQGEQYALFLFSSEAEEELACSKMLLIEALKIFSDTKEVKTLKKVDMKGMQKTYPVLDKYFVKLEYLIREIELKRPKNDMDWVLLSKYHIILSAKMNLSQIQNKLFSLMEEEIPIEVGLFSKSLNGLYFKKGKLNCYLNSIVAPVSALLARFYLENSHLADFKSQIDQIFIDYDHSFYKLHFSFLVLYVLILNLNNISFSELHYVSKYNTICKEIDFFNHHYRDYFL